MSNLDANQEHYTNQAQADGYRILPEPIDLDVRVRVVGVKSRGADSQGDPIQELTGYKAQSSQGDYGIPAAGVLLLARDYGIVVPPAPPEPEGDEEEPPADPAPTPTPVTG